MRLDEGVILRPFSVQTDEPIYGFGYKRVTAFDCRPPYAELNERIKRMTVPMPVVDDALAALTADSVRYMSCLDFTSAFFQLPLAPESRPMTTFGVGPGELLQFRVMPMGVSESPRFFQRLMTLLTSGVAAGHLLVFMDDLFIYTSTFEAHLRALREVFTVLRRADLMLNPAKCAIFTEEAHYLGHRVSKDGVRPSESTTLAVKEFATPTNVRQVRGFLGLCSWLRKFVKGFASRTTELRKLTVKDARFAWSEACQREFEDMKAALTSAPVLAHPCYAKPFKLWTDGSDVGLAACITQEDETGDERPVCYLSRALTEAERAYSARETEALAVVWALKTAMPMLLLSPITVFSDHASLQFLRRRIADLPQRVARWAQLADVFDLTIKHVRRTHPVLQAVDGLSKDPAFYEKPVQDGQAMRDAPPVFSAEALSPGEQRFWRKHNTPPEADGVVAVTKAADVMKLLEKKGARQGVIALQDEDDDFGPVRAALLRDQRYQHLRRTGPTRARTAGTKKQVPLRDHEVTPAVVRQAKQFVLDDDGLLCRELHNARLPVVPLMLRPALLEQAHVEHGAHLGVAKVWRQLRATVFWPGLKKDVRKFVVSCLDCVRHKGQRTHDEGAFWHSFPARVGQQVNVDLFGPLVRSDKGNRWVLLIRDAFSRWVEMVPLPDAEGITVAKAIFSEWICRYGAPRRVVSDQGANFLSRVVGLLYERFGVRRVTTSPFAPWSDGRSELSFRPIAAALGALTQDHPRGWDEVLPAVAKAMRTAPVAQMEETPFAIMFGRDPVLPLQALFELDEHGQVNTGVLGDTVAKEPTKTLEELDEKSPTPLRRTRARARARVAMAVAEAPVDGVAWVEAVHDRFQNVWRRGTARQVELAARRPRRGVMTVFPRGCLVLYHRPRKAKLAPMWLGPARVLRRSARMSYELRSLETGRVWFEHSKHMRLWREAPDDGSSEDAKASEAGGDGASLLEGGVVAPHPRLDGRGEADVRSRRGGSTVVRASTLPDTYEVEEVMDHRHEGKVAHFLVRWAGYPAEAATWEPEDHFLGAEAKATLQRYKEKHPTWNVVRRTRRRRRKR